jgi:hypothetical protein
MAQSSPAQPVITLTLPECDWLRIRASLICAAEDLAQARSDQESHYKGTYDLVKSELEPWLK